MSCLSSPNSFTIALPFILSSIGALLACSPIRFEGDPGAAGQNASDGAGANQAGSVSGGGMPSSTATSPVGQGGATASSIPNVSGASGSSFNPETSAAGAGGASTNPSTVPVGGGGGAAATAVNRLHFTRKGAMGFCIEDGAATDLNLIRRSDGFMSVEGSYARVSLNTSGQCGGQSYPENCVVPVSFVSFTLSAAQQRALDELLVALPEGKCEVSTLCDPCLVPTLELDGRTETSLCCGQQKAPGFSDKFREIEQFLDALIPRSPAFESFELRRGPGMGFCAPVGQAQSALFTRGADGALTLSGKRIESRLNSSAASCPEGTSAFVDAVCLSEIAPQRLTFEQQAKLEQLIGALPVGQCEHPPLLACDPCMVTSAKIDARVESSDCCGEQKTAGFGQAFSAIETYVDGLVP